MSAPRRSFRGDESGVSEVISYLFSFLMATMILVVTLYAFGQVNAAARELTAHAELEDVVNRVAVAVQESLLVAQSRNESTASITSDVIHFSRPIPVANQIQGWTYQIDLDQNFVNGTILSQDIRTTRPTFNVAVNLPPNPGACSTSYMICSLEGSIQGSNGRIVTSYLFNATAAPIENRILIQ